MTTWRSCRILFFIAATTLVMFGSLGPADAQGEKVRKVAIFIFPGVEDFGITPLEAQACGRPVIALGEGGALETVVAANRDEYSPPPGVSRWEDLGENPGGPTGLFFRRPEAEDVAEAVLAFEKNEDIFRPEAARRQAGRFCRDTFKNAVRERFMSGWKAHGERIHPRASV